MNKKLFIGMFAAAGMLFATSCSNDELYVESNGDTATISFNIGTTEASSRAISEAENVNKLYYSVFDENGDRIATLKQGEMETSFPATVNMALAKDQTYKIAFWAQSKECAAYSVSDDMVVSIDYTNAVNNSDLYDAFCGAVEFKVTGDQALDVILKRPFAQVNVGVTSADWEAAVASGVKVATSKVVVNKAANELNVLTGAVGETLETVTFASAAIPAEDLTVDDVNYKWLSMCYVLPATTEEKTALQSLAFTFEAENGKTISFANGLTSVPVQSNWRTNIVGQILTGNTTFNIKLDYKFGGDYEFGVPNSSSTEWYVSTAAEWIWLKNHGTAGKNIKLTADIDFGGAEVKGLGFTGVFDGQGYTMSNMTLLCGGSYYSNGLFQGDGSGVVTVKNVTVKNVKAECNNKDQGYVGAIFGDAQSNVTLEGVHVVNADLCGVQSVGGLVGFVASAATVTIKDCSVSDSYMHNYAVDNESGYVAGLVGRPVGTVNVSGSKVYDTKVVGYYASRRGAASVAAAIGDQENPEGVSVSNVEVKKISLEEAIVKVSTAEELGNIYGTDIIVRLTADIDFAGATLAKQITMLGNSIFDGQGYTIKNVVVPQHGGYATSLFQGDANGGSKVIKNLKIENLTASEPSEDGFAAAIWATAHNAVKIEIDNVHIYNSSISAANTIGGFIGLMDGSVKEGIVVKNSSINNTALSGGEASHKRGAVAGRAVACKVECENVVVNNVAINGVAATTSTIAGGNGYTGTVTVK